MTTPVTKTPRKFPPPCWTQDEALVLIEAYRDRWYALRRGYLRTADWESVAEEVGKRCPAASTPKTSAQCRHKIEKLRQRYRTEKQRALNYKGRFFSSWFYFDSMDAMENGSGSGSGSDKVDVNCNTNMSSLGARVSNGGYVDIGSDEEENDDDDDEDYRGKRFGNGRRVRTPVEQPIMPGFRSSRKIRKIDVRLNKEFDRDDVDDDEGYDEVYGNRGGNVPSGRISVDVGGSRGKFNGKGDVNSDPNFDPRVPNGVRSRAERKSGGGGVKRGGRSGIDDVVSSIKHLGEAFVKMEKMKMEMAKEIDKRRMEMEMKRNELLLESQQQIVDAFVKGLYGNKKMKTTVSPNS